MIWGQRVFPLLALLLAYGVPALAQQAAPPQAEDRPPTQAASDERARIASQLANVERLLNQSSGARRVLASDSELARNIRLDALERHKKAQAAHAAGDSETARRLLYEASLTMFQAVRVLGPAPELVEKQISDFEARAESTRVLLQALQRIAAEEGVQAGAANTVDAVEKSIAEARRLLDAGHRDEARKLLDGGYELTKAAVEGLRDGKTLVRSLTFATPEEEYRYELDRNDTHHMLVQVVLRDKPPTAQAAAVVEQSVQRAGAMRSEAENMAAGGRFEDAIQLLEQSTGELVRAIRGAGLYIPG